MKAPKNIADKVRRYQKAQARANKAFKEVENWLNNNANADGLFITGIEIAPTPKGNPQGDGEYVKQWERGESGDWFEGIYYIPVEGTAEYLAYNYST